LTRGHQDGPLHHVRSEFKDAAEFGIVVDERPNLAPFHHHLISVRAAVLRELWRREMFIGVSVIDEMLFDAVKDASIANPVQHVLELIRDHGLHRPGFLLFPVHSLGVLGAGLVSITEEADFSIFIDEYGLAARPQSNSYKKTVAFLEEVRTHFGITQRLPRETLEHWRRSRRLNWMESNPLLAVSTQSFPGSYYENQSLLIAKLRFAASLIFMFSALEHPRADNGMGRLTSTAAVNNWETLDLHHYVVLFRSPKGKDLSGDCIPMMNQSSSDLVEPTDLSVDLNPAHWKKKTGLGSRVVAAIQRVQAGYFKHQFHAGKDSTRARVHRKLFNALKFFRRSFRTTVGSDEAIVNLGASFEVLLSDGGKGVGKRIKRRLALALEEETDRKAMMEAIENLYGARSEAIHAGETNVEVDLRGAQRTFVHAFMSVAERLDKVDNKSSQPMADILGDKREEEPEASSPILPEK